MANLERVFQLYSLECSCFFGKEKRFVTTSQGAKVTEEKRREEGITESNALMMRKNRRAMALCLEGIYLISPGNC